MFRSQTTRISAARIDVPRPTLQFRRLFGSSARHDKETKLNPPAQGPSGGEGIENNPSRQKGKTQPRGNRAVPNAATPTTTNVPLPHTTYNDYV